MPSISDHVVGRFLGIWFTMEHKGLVTLLGPPCLCQGSQARHRGGAKVYPRAPPPPREWGRSCQSCGWWGIRGGARGLEIRICLCSRHFPEAPPYPKPPPPPTAHNSHKNCLGAGSRGLSTCLQKSTLCQHGEETTPQTLVTNLRTGVEETQRVLSQSTNFPKSCLFFRRWQSSVPPLLPHQPPPASNPLACGGRGPRLMDSMTVHGGAQTKVLSTARISGTCHNQKSTPRYCCLNRLVNVC